MNRSHLCVRFEEAGRMRIGELAIDQEGVHTRKSLEQTLWKCADCGRLMWFRTGIDPNVRALVKLQERAERN